MADDGRYVVCYDVTDDKRRLKIVKLLEGYGDRVQYSVFEMAISPDQLSELVEKLLEKLDPGADRATVYAICGACERRVIRLGRTADVVPGEEDVFIV